MKKCIISLCLLGLSVAGYVYADCISGNCENREGTYAYADGGKYIGQWKDGKRYGQGTFTTSKGNKYIGQWKDGKMDGQGTFTSSKGNKYGGQWKDGKMHGRGTMYNSNGTIIHKGRWENNEYVGK